MKRTQKQFNKELETALSTTPWSKRKDICKKMHLEWWNELEIGDRAHIQRYADTEPCTIIHRNEKSIAVRLDLAINTSNLPNNNTSWNITEDIYGKIEMFYLCNGPDFGFMNRHGEKLLPGWDKYKDFNFYNN